MKIITLPDGSTLPGLEGAGNYPFVLLVDGEDLLARDVLATFFGGSKEDDPGDNGQTECGVSTRNPDGSSNTVLGCSLPMDTGPCKGSPIPVLPCKITVRIFNPANGNVIEVPRLDQGPLPPPQAQGIIDLTRETSRRLLGSNQPDNLRVDFRIIGGAKFLSAEIQAQLAQLNSPH